MPSPEINPYGQQANPGFVYPAAPTPQKKPLWKKWWFWLVTVLAIFALFSVGIYAILKYADHADQQAALDACEQGVIDQAKYPGGVSFPEEIDIWTDASLIDIDRTYRAFGDVDFPNGYGTPVRENYGCTITVNSGEVVEATVSVSEAN
ncbi:DUF1129 domain-containing protein [Corynebacterium minutissimum]|uniref:DUF1129 domain-containing protein n=1 Tax=Corynebacterium minutissimum TaxID=38301 RepID=UPI001EF390F4|nr:DUF1129 domain-containing protein [Corynebacterium minutissimum]MCG7239606.1 DUF1129 domain-containing protein [Corynebacterium minutissimum]